METREIYASLALMPEFPRYQAYLESVARRMPGALSHRCAALVHQIVFVASRHGIDEPVLPEYA